MYLEKLPSSSDRNILGDTGSSGHVGLKHQQLVNWHVVRAYCPSTGESVYSQVVKLRVAKVGTGIYALELIIIGGHRYFKALKR